MVNRVVLVGRLTRDPNELRVSPSGVSVTSFTVAVDNRFSKQEGNKADFIPVVVFNKTAEFVCNYARKGSLVAVEGRLQQRTYQNKDNQTVNVLEVVADNVYFADSKSENASAGTQQSAPASYGTPAYSAPSYPASDFAMLEDDDAQLPF